MDKDVLGGLPKLRPRLIGQAAGHQVCIDTITLRQPGHELLPVVAGRFATLSSTSRSRFRFV